MSGHLLISRDEHNAIQRVAGSKTLAQGCGANWQRPVSVIDKVLVLDGNTRSALATTRSLGSRGIYVVAGDSKRRTLSSTSRFCSGSFTYPPPDTAPEAFIGAVKDECSRRGLTVLLPMTEITTTTVLRHREKLARLVLPFVDCNTFEEVSDKWRLFELAERLNLPVPHTYLIRNLASLANVYPLLKYPIVLKPYRSNIEAKGRWIWSAVKYVTSIEQLEETVNKYEYFRHYPFLIQDYIVGDAQGVFALYDHGTPIAFFSHRRLRERPPSGGVSVLSESIAPNPVALRTARTLLDYAGWHGVAMVEFKVAFDGTPYLMEVNGRFWGSLQLAIDAGVDFPWLLYQLATGREVDKVDGYATGVKCRWLVGDLVSLCKVLFASRSSFCQHSYGKLRSVFQFFKLFEKNTRYEVNRWRDVRPFLCELYQLLRR